MTRIITLNSFRGGTGRSVIAGHLAYLAASQGTRVGVLDRDLLSPNVDILFGIAPENIDLTVTDFLFGKCELEEVALEFRAIEISQDRR